MNISIIGTGYVGLVTGACFAKLGNNVICVDVDENKINQINSGKSLIFESGLEDLLADYKDKICATLDYNKAISETDITFICVGTPSKNDGSIDLCFVKQASEEIGKQLKFKDKYHVVVVKSTVLPGTSKDVVLPIIEKKSGKKAGVDFGVAMNPEFLKEGVAIEDFLNPDRIVIGFYNNKSKEVLKELYSSFTCPFVETDLSTAEMIKYASNAFLATKISFINEIGNMCKKLGIDTYKVAKGIGHDKRIGRAFLDSGIGWGGSCLKGEEKILILEEGNSKLISFKELYDNFSNYEDGVIHPRIDVLSWNFNKKSCEFKKVNVMTKRKYKGKINTLHTSMRKKVSVTEDHPLLIIEKNEVKTKLSRNVGEGDRLPVMINIPEKPMDELDVIEIIQNSDEFPNNEVYLKAIGFELKEYKSKIKSVLKSINYDKRFTYSKSFDIIRGNYLPLDLFLEIENKLPFSRADLTIYTSTGLTTYVPAILKLDDNFWRFIGYYISEGCINTDSSGHGKKARKRIMISFNYKNEEEYVKDVENFLSKLGIKFKTQHKKTSTQITFSSRVFAFVLENYLECGKDSYTAKLPDIIYTQSESDKLALLSGLYRGDGHIAFPNHSNAVVYEYGSISKSLIQGLQFLLHSLNIVPSYNTSTSAKATAPAHFLRISSQNQIKKLKNIYLKKDQQNIEDRLSQYKKIIKPTGHKKENNLTTVKLRKLELKDEETFVYSLEVQDNKNFVTTDGLIVHNCFPKDINALILHAKKIETQPQILKNVVKVNEVQPLKMIELLKKHILDLQGKTIGVLGLAFKPNTDDIRESRAIPIVTRLLTDGAQVKAYDPEAIENFRKILPDVEYCSSAQEVLNSDAILITTKWEEFKKLDYKENIVIDGRRLDEAKKARIYVGVCW